MRRSFSAFAARFFFWLSESGVPSGLGTRSCTASHWVSQTHEPSKCAAPFAICTHLSSSAPSTAGAAAAGVSCGGCACSAIVLKCAIWQGKKKEKKERLTQRQPRSHLDRLEAATQSSAAAHPLGRIPPIWEPVTWTSHHFPLSLSCLFTITLHHLSQDAESVYNRCCGENPSSSSHSVSSESAGCAEHGRQVMDLCAQPSKLDQQPATTERVADPFIAPPPCCNLTISVGGADDSFDFLSPIYAHWSRSSSFSTACAMSEPQLLHFPDQAR